MPFLVLLPLKVSLKVNCQAHFSFSNLGSLLAGMLGLFPDHAHSHRDLTRF